MLQQIRCRYCGKTKQWKANEKEPVWYIGQCDSDYTIVSTDNNIKGICNSIKRTCYFCSTQCIEEYKITTNNPTFVAEPDIQKPELNNQIELTADDELGVSANTTCMCGHGSIEVLIDANLDIPSLVFTYTVGKWDTKGSLWNRIKMCCKILFTGEIKLEEEFIFRGNDHIKALLDTIEYGLNRIK